MTGPAPTAYAYRAHSGFFGIVNSEEAYQNLARFLFGDLRVDIWVDVDEVRLPKALKGKKVEALYQFELLAGPRGKRWYLTRRVAEEDSPACRTHAQLAGGTRPGDRNVYLSTVFLANRARVNPERASLAYAMTVGVRVPDYQVDKRFWADEHYEGGYLFRDTAVVEMVPPAQPGKDWVVHYGWQSETANRARHALSYDQLKGGQIQFTIPFDNGADPGIAGHIRLVAQAWNA